MLEVRVQQAFVRSCVQSFKGTYTTPAESSRQVVPGAEWQHADGGARADAVEHAQHPAHRAVAAARQHAHVRHLAEQLQTEIELCYKF